MLKKPDLQQCFHLRLDVLIQDMCVVPLRVHARMKELLQHGLVAAELVQRGTERADLHGVRQDRVHQRKETAGEFGGELNQQLHERLQVVLQLR